MTATDALDQHVLDGLLNALDWRELDRPKGVEGHEGLYVTHESTLRFAGAEFRVYRLSDGRLTFEEVAHA